MPLACVLSLSYSRDRACPYTYYIITIVSQYLLYIQFIKFQITSSILLSNLYQILQVQSLLLQVSLIISIYTFFNLPLGILKRSYIICQNRYKGLSLSLLEISYLVYIITQYLYLIYSILLIIILYIYLTKALSALGPRQPNRVYYSSSKLFLG